MRTPTNLWPAPTAIGPVHGTVAVPGSKSLMARALVLAAAADGPSSIRSPLRARDTLLMAAALASALGTRIDQGDGVWTVTPGTAEGDAAVDCGLSGTVMRFVPPLAGLTHGRIRFDGDRAARDRPMGALLDGIRQAGVAVADDGRGALPFDIVGTGRIRGGHVRIDASTSSQFVTGLLLAGARYDEGVEVEHVGGKVPSRPHIDMTVAQLRERGVTVEETGPTSWRVHPCAVGARDVTIEPDLSNAAPFLAAALVTGGSVTVPGWPAATDQPGDRLRDLFSAMGGRVTRTTAGVTVEGGGRLVGIDADLSDVGELTPVIAAVCALASTPSKLRGVGHLRGHETDRLAALERELNVLGGSVIATADELLITPTTLHAGTFATYDDHRIAQAAAVIGVAVPGVQIENIATTAKTMPDFARLWTDLVAGADAEAPLVAELSR